MDCILPERQGRCDKLDIGELGRIPGKGIYRSSQTGAMATPTVVPVPSSTVNVSAVPKSTTTQEDLHLSQAATASATKSAPTSYGLTTVMGNLP